MISTKTLDIMCDSTGCLIVGCTKILRVCHHLAYSQSLNITTAGSQLTSRLDSSLFTNSLAHQYCAWL
jgi:hypothetical protein